MGRQLIFIIQRNPRCVQEQNKHIEIRNTVLRRVTCWKARRRQSNSILSLLIYCAY